MEREGHRSLTEHLGEPFDQPGLVEGIFIIGQMINEGPRQEREAG